MHMQTPSVITFKLSRHKKRGLFLTTLCSALVGAGGVHMAQNLRYGEGRFVFIVIGIFALLVTFFCCMAYFHLTREHFNAIYISNEGIKDVSTGNRIGIILWKDIENIKIMDDISNLKRKYIVMKVKNPNEYIDREPTRSKKRSLELRMQFYGSPICISNRALDCTFEELKEAVYNKYNVYKSKEDINRN